MNDKQVAFSIGFLVITLFICNCTAPREIAKPISYQDVSFKKLIQPAFASDFSGKGVRFEAQFFEIMGATMDLPKNTKNMFVLYFVPQ